VSTKQELLLREMNVKLARAVLSLQRAFVATNPAPNSEVVEELTVLSQKLTEFMDILDRSDELDKVG